jgi:peptidoglycan L-alanyl-D-glutamate endopeptidase CwlK
MLKYGARSKKNFEGVHPDLVKVLTYVLEVYGFDHTIVSGVRSDDEQIALYAKGRDSSGNIVDPSRVVTHVDGINKRSNHQTKSDGYGHAVDAYPYPIDLSRKRLSVVRYYHMASYVKAAAIELFTNGEISHLVRWGGDWDSDNVFSDQKFHDLPHYELYKP